MDKIVGSGKLRVKDYYCQIMKLNFQVKTS
jgi:hypothetical protein